MLKKILSKKNGFILISLVISIIFIGLCYSIIASVYTGYTYSNISYKNIVQAYYVAESGIRFSLSKLISNNIEEVKTTYPHTQAIYKLENSSLESNNTDENYIDNSNAGFFGLEFQSRLIENDTISSIGTVSLNNNRPFTYTNFEAQRKIYLSMSKPVRSISVPSVKKEDFQFLWINDKIINQKSFDIVKQIVKKDSKTDAYIFTFRYIKDEFPIQNSFLGVGKMYLNWLKNQNLPDFSKWQTDIKTLSYMLQTKIYVPEKAKHYMAGILFRCDTFNFRTYGISFFKSAGRKEEYPKWLTPNGETDKCGYKTDSIFPDECISLDSDSFYFDDEDSNGRNILLETDTPYIIFWVQTSNDDPYLIIGCHKLSKEYVQNGSLKSWNTLGLILDEIVRPPYKKNKIQVLAAAKSTDYDRNSEIRWDGPVKGIKWDYILDDYPQLHSPDYKKLKEDDSKKSQQIPEEIGLHIFYDPSSFKEINENSDIIEVINDVSDIEKRIWFDDFAIECSGASCPDESTQSLVQY